MSLPLSIVIPTLDDRELLATCLAALLPELERRALGDEVVVVDDSGAADGQHGSASADSLAAHLAASDAGVSGSGFTLRCLANSRNLGFARSLHAGVAAARHGLVLALNPDVCVRPGALEPLVETLTRHADVALVAPYVLQGGEDGGEESVPALVFEDGFHRIVRSPLDVTPGEVSSAYPDGVPAGFALGGACLMRRDEFLAAPYDPRFEPFYWEDVDLAERARAAGRRVLVDPRSVVEHWNRGTIGERVPESLVRAAIEKNRLLFTWKHERDPERLREHLETLAGRVLEHATCEQREELIWLLLALEQSPS